MKIFARLTKYNEDTGYFEAVAADQSIDKAKERFHYETSKPHFQKWSENIAKATDGKSFGNVRSMHGKNAAGKLTGIEFDDNEMAIKVAGMIVDPVDKTKMSSGVYTGVSIGGDYEKRWDDETNPGVKWYTAIPAEISVVDNPCNSNAYFTMVKMDGSEAEVPLVGDAEKIAVDELAKILDEGKVKPSELVKYATAQTEAVIAADKAIKIEALKKALANPQLTNGEFEAFVKQHLTDEQVAAIQGTEAEKSLELYKQLRAIAGEETVVEEVLSQPDTEVSNVDKTTSIAVASFAAQPLIKGLYTLGRMASACEQLWSLQEDTASEAESEGDGSAVPDRLHQLCIEAGEILCEMAEEETQEMANKAEVIGNLHGLFKAKPKNKEYQQRTHDRVVKMGAKCATAEKVDAVDAGALCKAVGMEGSNLEEFGKLFMATKAKADKWDALPAIPKGSLRTFEKGTDALPPTETQLSARDEELVRAAGSGDPLAHVALIHKYGGNTPGLKK